MRSLVVLGLLGFLVHCGATKGADILGQRIRNPPVANHPAVYAFMLPYGTIPDDVIKRDLEEMKAKGVSACLIYSPGAEAPCAS